MVDHHLAALKLAELADRVERVQRHCPAAVAALRDDRDALDLVSFNLMLAVQTRVSPLICALELRSRGAWA